MVQELATRDSLSQKEVKTDSALKTVFSDKMASYQSIPFYLHSAVSNLMVHYKHIIPLILVLRSCFPQNVLSLLVVLLVVAVSLLLLRVAL